MVSLLPILLEVTFVSSVEKLNPNVVKLESKLVKLRRNLVKLDPNVATDTLV